MSLFNTLYRLVGRERVSHDSKPDSSHGPHCPNEADIFIYVEGRISSRKRAELENHFASCDDCRELLALFIKIPDKNVEGYDAYLAPLSDDGVRKQAARVLAFIENDEHRRTQPATEQTTCTEIARKREGIYVSYSALASLAMIVCAIAVGVTFWLSIDRRPDDAMDALRLAVKNERRTPARISISGGLDYSPYSEIRGEEDSEILQFERALDKLKYAQDESAPADARLALARVHLALGTGDEAKKALPILEQLVAGGRQSADVLNDLGVAQFHLEHYGEAIANFTRALEKSPGFTEALFNRALAQQRANRVEAAKQDWQQFIRLTSDEKWRLEAERWLELLQPARNQSNSTNPVQQ